MDLPYPVLCDSDLEVARTYGLIHEKGYMFQDVARPATLLIGQDRVIRRIWIEDNIRPRPAVAEIFDELRK
jgi:peroxiredoxin